MNASVTMSCNVEPGDNHSLQERTLQVIKCLRPARPRTGSPGQNNAEGIIETVTAHKMHRKNNVMGL